MAIQAQGKVSIIDRATRPLKGIANAFKLMGNESKKSNTELSKTQMALNGLSKAESRIGRTQKAIKRNADGFQSQAVGVAAFALSMKQALAPAIKFEQAMKDLESVAFGAADSTVPVAQNMALLSDQAKQLGATTAFSATQAAEGQLFLAKAGFNTNQILQSMPALLNLSSASATELGRASDITSDLLGAFGMQASQTGELADVLAAATSSANVDMETLFETLKVAAPIGISAGQSMQSMVTATALLGNVGIKGSNAGTALKNALTNLASPAAKGSQILKELGVVVEDAEGNMLPLQDIMLKLGKSAKTLSQAKQIQVFSGIFGKEAMAGAINLEKSINSGDFAKMLTNLQNAEGIAEKMAKIRMDSTEGSFKALMSASEGIAITFGQHLNPMIRGFTELITMSSNPIQTFLKENGDIVKAIGLVGAGLLTAKVASLAFTASLWLVSPAITALKISLIALKVPLMGFNLLMKANPVMGITTAIIALATAGTLLYKNWDKVTDTFNNLWELLKNFDFNDILGSIKGIGEALGLDSLFGGNENAQSQSQAQINPQQAINQIQANQTVQPAPIQVNTIIQDGKVKSTEVQGSNQVSFLQNGVQQ